MDRASAVCSNQVFTTVRALQLAFSGMRRVPGPADKEDMPCIWLQGDSLVRPVNGLKLCGSSVSYPGCSILIHSGDQYL